MLSRIRVRLVITSRVISLVLFSMVLVQLAKAEPMQRGLSVQVAHEYQDNALLTENKTQNQSDSLLVDVNVDHRSNRYQTRVFLTAEHESNSAIEDRDIFEGSAQLDVSLLPERLSWTFQDVLSQVRIDPLTPLTPTNAINTQNLSTGPDWRWQITTTDQLLAQLRAEQVVYEGSNFIDRDRLKSSVQWLHQWSPVWQVGLGVQRIDEQFDPQGNSQQGDIKLNTFNTVLERNSTRTQLALTLGQTQVEALNSHESVGSLQWRYQLNSAWNLLANAQRAVSSDIDTQQGGGELLTNAVNPTGQTIDVGNVLNTQNSNLGDIFNANNILSVDQSASLSSEWLWSQRQLSLTVNRRTSRQFLDQPISVADVDEIEVAQQILRLYHPLNPRWWWMLQYTLQQTRVDNLSAQQSLDEQLVMTELGYRIKPGISLTQNIFFQHYDETSQLPTGLSTTDVDAFRYLIGLTWTL